MITERRRIATVMLAVLTLVAALLAVLVPPARGAAGGEPTTPCTWDDQGHYAEPGSGLPGSFCMPGVERLPPDYLDEPRTLGTFSVRLAVGIDQTMHVPVESIPGWKYSPPNSGAGILFSGGRPYGFAVNSAIDQYLPGPQGEAVPVGDLGIGVGGFSFTSTGDLRFTATPDTVDGGWLIFTMLAYDEQNRLDYTLGFAIQILVDDAPKPRASFSVRSDTPPGTRVFTATSTSPVGSPLSHQWDLGDGSAAQGTPVVHRYERPGTYHVTLTSRDQNGQTDSVTKHVVVDPPKLSATIDLLDGVSSPLEPDQEVRVRVRVAAADDGVGSIEHVHFDDVLLKIAPAMAFDVVDGPTPTAPADGFDLAPGGRKDFTYTLRAAALGRFTLSTAVTGTDGTGTVQHAAASAPGIVGEPLQVSIALDPEHSDQPEGPDGPQPVDVTATITFTNHTPDAMDAVTLTSLRVDRTAPGQLLAVTQIGGADPGDDGLAIGPLEPGESKSVTALFRASDDAEVEFSAQAVGHFADGRSELGVGKKKWTLRPKYLLDFRTRVVNPAGSALLPAGELIRVSGTVHNLSTSATVEVGPVYPETSGNAGIMSLAWNTTGTDPTQFVPSQPIMLEPGESRDFTVRVLTSYSDPRINDETVSHSGGVFARLHFIPYGTATFADGTTENVTPAKMRTTEADLTRRVSIDDSISIPTADPLAVLGAGFIGGLEGLWSGTVNVVSQAKDLLKLPYTAVMAISEFQSQVWDSFTDEEKVQFDNDVALMAAAVLMRNADLAKDGAAVLWQRAKDVSLKVMTDAANDWEAGDYTSTVELYAKWSTDQLTQVVAPIAFGKLLKSKAALSALARVQAAIQKRMAPLLAQVGRIKKITEVAPLLVKIASGTELTAEEAKLLYGIAPEELAELQRLSTKYNFLLTVRSRAVSSLDWIQRGARLKPEVLKIKAVSELDAALGYGEKDVGSLVFRKPEALTEYENLGGNLDDHIDRFVQSKGFKPGTVDYQNAVKRVVERAKEWKKHEAEYKYWDERGWVDTTFNGKDNGVPDPYLPERTKIGVAPLASGKYEGFRLFPIGKDAFVVEMLDARTGRFVRITGDIDPIAFTHLDGTPLTVTEHAALLKELERNPLLQGQHGESATYVNGGVEFIASQFKGEPGLQIAPGTIAPRVVRFTTGPKTRWISPEDYHLHWDGGFEYSGSYVPRGAVPKPATVLPVPEPLPVARPMPLPQSTNGRPNVGRLTIKFGTGPEAANAYLDVKGKIVTLGGGDGKASAPSPLQDDAFGDNDRPAHTVLVKPVTGLTKPAQVGQTELPIPEGDPWLASAGADLHVGDVVVIGAGTPHAEAHEIVAFGSIIIDHGLRYAHPAGDLIMLVKAAASGSSAGTAATGPAAAPQLLITGGLLIVLGVELVWFARRRRRRRS